MKKWIVWITALLMVILLTGCGKTVDADVQKAEKTLTETWSQLYLESGRGDGYLEIKNTRVIHVKADTANKDFKNIDKIVEFILYSDYFEAAPYYSNCATYDTVILYKDGRSEVVPVNPIDMYRSMSYSSDFSDFVEKVEDLGSVCNKAMDLK